MIAKRTDANHALLMTTLRQLGWQVIDLHTAPNFVDAIAQRGQHLRLLEFKAGPAARFTLAQQALLDQGWPICVLRSVEDCEQLR